MVDKVIEVSEENSLSENNTVYGDHQDIAMPTKLKNIRRPDRESLKR